MIFCNRTLNLKKITHIGLDMDHTLVRYYGETFESLAYESMKKKLVQMFGYPDSVLELKFDYKRAIRGLVLDRTNGNILKVSRFGMVKEAYHGLEKIDFKDQRRKFGTKFIDLRDPSFDCVDTTFSISHTCLFTQIVNLKSKGQIKFDFPEIAEHLAVALDESHRDGSVKDEVIRNPDKYIKKSPEIVEGIKKFKSHGKKFFIATNSDYKYTKELLNFAINPFLEEGENWTDFFDYTFTLCMKPRFFDTVAPLLKINLDNGSMENWNANIVPGVYQGGSANLLSESFKATGDQILYVGDHIYGDILTLKKRCGWRTALVVEELENEIMQNQKTVSYNTEIKLLMSQKMELEGYLNELVGNRFEKEQGDVELENKVQDKIAKLDQRISPLIEKTNVVYNEHWGPVMRAGVEESQFAIQVEGFSDIYMPDLEDLLEMSPRYYFRAYIRKMAHDL